MNASTPARRLTSLLLTAPVALALTACGAGAVHLTPEQLEAALLTEEEFPLQASADTMAQDAVTLDADSQLFNDYTAESVDEQCAAALNGVYPDDGVQAPTAIGDYATGKHRIIVRTMSLPEQAELDLEEGFAAIAEACDGQTLAGADGEGLTLTALSDDAPAGFHQSVTSSSPLWAELMAELTALLDTHRVVSQDGNNAVEVMGIGLSETEARDILEAQEAKLADAVAAAR